MTTIPISAALADAPLAELKQWLAITGTRDDALLIRLLETSCQACVQFTGTTFASWADLDQALRQGVIRLAAHQFSQRDNAADRALPAAVAALWRPFRVVRL